MAAVGFTAIFAATTGAPLASTLMGAEIFGWETAMPVGAACLLARFTAGGTHLYRKPPGTPGR